MFMQTNGKPTDRASLQLIFSYKWFKFKHAMGMCVLGEVGVGKGREERWRTGSTSGLESGMLTQ